MSGVTPVPIKDGDLITMYYNPNPGSVSGVTNSGVFAVYDNSATQLILSTSKALVFTIQSLSWSGSDKPNDYSFNNDGLPLVTGNYLSFETSFASLTHYLQSGLNEPPGISEFIDLVTDTPVDKENSAPYRVWNITTTTPQGVGLFQGSLNASSSNTATRTWVTPVGQTLYYGQNYYIQNVGKAVIKSELYYWNQQSSSLGVGLNTVSSSTMPVVFLDNQGQIPGGITPVLPKPPAPPPKAPTKLDHFERELLIYGGIAVIVIIIVIIIIAIVLLFVFKVA